MLVFGGYDDRLMFKLSEEGQVVQDCSGNKLIPSYMAFNSFITQPGKVLSAAFVNN